MNKNFNLFRYIAPLLLVLTCISFNSCEKKQEKRENKKLFTALSSKQTAIHFKNEIVESETFYYYKYIYSYNGAGVASADFDNDNKQDLFFVSSLGENKLYINQGGLKFKDITAKAGISVKKGFNTGVSIVDINNDGFLDIYISRAGWFKDNSKCANLLYINNGDLTFKEQAETFGLADTNRSIQATFFDYDKDGDLDVYIVNAPYSNRRLNKLVDLSAIKNDKKTKDLGGSDSFYENKGNNTFVNISEKAGIVPDIAFGLNAQIGDLNNDGWLDIYVNNDFDMPDFAYINNKNGTFTDKREDLFKHQSFYSMGGDIADINNDGFLDMISLDMNPEDYIRSKTTMSMTSVKKFNAMVNNGYHHQYMHNALQLNNGNETFSEIANMAGVANTDWSWSSLFADFDLDGYNDLYVTNGVFRDVIDKDASNKILGIIKQKGKKPTPKEFLEYTKMLPQHKLSNYFFKNNGDLTFSNTSTQWHTVKPTFSNGAVYTDLDNDGDLDIVVNNINDEATILKNNAVDTNKGHFLQLEFKGSPNNPFGIGTTVNIQTKAGNKQTRQLINSRGYMSSTSNKLHFGLANNQNIEKIDVVWPDGKTQQLTNIKANQLLTLNYSEATRLPDTVQSRKSNITFKEEPFGYKHIDSVFNDFNIQVLLPHKLSQLGPAIAKADINNDGVDDLYLGGGYSQAGQLLIGLATGGFKKSAIPDFKKDALFEDTGAVFFDLENDGDLDLYVVSGSYEFSEGSKGLQDRIYKNNGNGNYNRCLDCLPEFYTAGSIVTSSDFDEDGDTDLFVGGRVLSGKYPYSPKSYLLINNNGKYTIETNTIAKELENIGMVTDAVWANIDNDTDLDLILTGEWMGIEIFENENGKLSKRKNNKTLSQAKGWWNKIHIADVDNDGDKDIIAGNLGLNTKFHTSKEKPFEIYTSDFDKNGTQDIFLAKYYNGKQVPVRGKSCSSQQIPQLYSKIKSYNEFANKDLEGILGPEIKSALNYQALEFKSGIFKNDNNEFTFIPFSNEAQTTSINSILFEDFDNDGFKDIVMAGNNYQTEVETTRLDAGIGSYFKGDKKGDFKYVPNYINGLFADKDVRNALTIETAKGKKLLIINNNNKHSLFKIITHK